MLQIVEVGPRDGLQSHDAFVPTERKVQLIERLVAAGLTEIEATSFAHPKMVPHLADAAEVMARLPRVAGVRYRGLVPNAKGAERAVDAGVDLVVAFISASAAYSEKNQNMTIAAALEQLEAISEVAHGAGVPWMAGISMAFGSPYEDEIPVDDVLGLIARVAAWEPERVYVADTVGGAAPPAVRAMCSTIVARWPDLPLSVHLHGADVRGLACAVAAVDGGAVQVETSICGLGGPVVRSPGAEIVGNLATEAVASTFADLGIDTGLDADAIRAAARDIAELLELPGERLAPDAAEVEALARGTTASA
jgi:hydroxymethylglutaryl-CoA lyase